MNKCNIGADPGRVEELRDDPRQPLDYVTAGLIGLGLIPFIAGNVVMVINRSYLPIKTKSVELTVISSVGGVIWLGSSLVTNNHFGRPKDTLWTVCSLWTFWMQACFGFGLWLNCLIVRLIDLYYILILQRGPFRSFSLPLPVLLSPNIIFCICASVFRASRFVVNDHETGKHPLGNCNLQNGWAIGLLVLFPFYFCIFLFLGVHLRNVRPIYNEFRLIVNGGILSLFLFLLSLVTFKTQVYKEPPGRCFLVLAVSGTVFYYFYARNGEAVYNCLFNKQAYLEKFRAQLNAVPSSSHSRNFDNPAEMMLYDVREETQQLLSEVSSLEKELEKLLEQLKKERAPKAITAPVRQEGFK